MTASLKSIEDLRAALKDTPPKFDSDADGRDGEEYARVWMRSRGIAFVDIPQKVGEIPPALRALGGKRPDFGTLWDNDEFIVWLDAKHHNVDSGEFWMHDDEIAQYKQLEAWSRTTWPDGLNLVAFVVVAKYTNGRRIYVIGLDELIGNGAPCVRKDKPARAIAISGKEADW